VRESHGYQFLLQAIASPALHSIIALVMNGSRLSIVRFDMRSGRVVTPMYQPKSLRLYFERHAPLAVFLAADITGRYLMLGENHGDGLGWLHDGRLHILRRESNLGETITF